MKTRLIRILLPASVLIIFALVQGVVVSSSHQLAPGTTPVLVLLAPSGYISPDESLDVELTVQGAKDLGAFEFDLLYDQDLLQVTGVTLSEFLGDTSNCDANTSRCAAASSTRRAGPT